MEDADLSMIPHMYFGGDYYYKRRGPTYPSDYVVPKVWSSPRTHFKYEHCGERMPHHVTFQTILELDNQLSTSRLEGASVADTLPKHLQAMGVCLTIRWTDHPWYSFQTVSEGFCPVVLLQTPLVTGITSAKDMALLFQCLENTVAYVASYDRKMARDSVDAVLSAIHPDYVWGTSVGGRVRFLNHAWETLTEPAPLVTKIQGKRVCKLRPLPNTTMYSTITSALAKSIPTDLEERSLALLLEFLHHVTARGEDGSWLPVLLHALLTNQPEPRKGMKAAKYFDTKDRKLAEALGVDPANIKNNKVAGVTLRTVAHSLRAMGFDRAAADMTNTRAWRGWQLLARLSRVWQDHPQHSAHSIVYGALCEWVGLLPQGAERLPGVRVVKWLRRKATLKGTPRHPPAGASFIPTTATQKCIWYLAGKLCRPPSSRSFRVYDKLSSGLASAAQLWAAALSWVARDVPDFAEEAKRGLDILGRVSDLRHTQACVKLVSGTQRKHLKCLNLLFPPTGWTDDRHVTCRLADVAWTYLHPTSQADAEERYIMERIARAGPPTLEQRLRQLNSILGTIPIGTNNVLATSFVLSSLGVEADGPFRAHIARRGLLFTHVEGQAAALKAISTCVRRTATALSGEALLDSEAAKLAAYDMMFGRAANTTDWAEEIHNRCSKTIPLGLRCAGRLSDSILPPRVDTRAALTPPRPIERDDFQRRLNAKIAVVINRLADKRSATSTLADFWARRGEWMTSGSSSGAQLQVPSSLPPTVKSRLGEHITLSKRGWAEATPFSDILKAFNSPKPIEMATASEKMENGKARAIYGVTPEHYVINTFATAGLEERLHLQEGFEKGAEGIAAYATDVHRADLTARAGIEMTMLDYADFNRHHSPEHQAAVFTALAAWGRKNGASADWVKANEWVAASKFNMKCRFPDKQVRAVKQGMFSGTRSTDLINTILNLCYFQVAADLVKEEYGLVPQQLYHVHQGDDVWLSNRSSTWARYLYATLAALGLLFQPQKQMFGPGRGEYLRVIYSGGRGYGYMARALANFLLRPVQNDVALDPAAWAASIHDGVSTLLRRGLGPTAASCIWRATMPFWTRVQAHPRDERPILFPSSIRTAPRYLGGLACGFPLGYDFLLEPAQPFPTYRRQAPPWVGDLPGQMTDDWIRQLAAKLHPTARVIDVRRVKDSILATSYDDILRVADHHTSNANFKKQVSHWLAHHKARRNSERGRISFLDPAPLNRSGVGAQSPAIHLLAQEAHCIGTDCPQVETVAGLGHVLAGVKGCRQQARQGESGYKNSVAKWLASTPFKSLDLAMSAYGMKATDVLAMLMAQYTRTAAQSASGLAILAPILRSKSGALVDLILGGGPGVACSLAWTVHKALLSYCQTEAVDQVLNINCTSYFADASPLARGCVRALGALLIAGLKIDRLALTKVLY